MYAKRQEIYPAYDSKNNSNHEKQVIIVTISNIEKQWHYLATIKPSESLSGVTSRHYGNFYCLNCLHSFRTKNKLELHKRRACENKDFCHVIVPSEDTNIRL